MEIFGPFAANAILDMDRLVLGGHSFGGITAITTATKLNDNDQPAALTVYDPWFFPNSEDFEYKQAQIKCPIFVANSENWHLKIPKQYYDHWKLVHCALQNTKLQDKIEHVIVRQIGHECQTDFAVYDAWLLGMVLMSM